jgi:PadR family transcriptional regulator, regulatory protein AphA
MHLTGTSYAVLGLVASGARTGYELSRVAANSTRFFWAASDGQVYPELRRLSDAGYLTARSEPQGERPRKVYSLTPAGREALAEWLAGGGDLRVEHRDEGLLKLFVGEEISVADARRLLAQMRGARERALSLLESLEPQVSSRPSWYVTLRTGMNSYRSAIAWLSHLERALDAADPETRAMPLLAAAAVEFPTPVADERT